MTETYPSNIRLFRDESQNLNLDIGPELGCYVEEPSLMLLAQDQQA